MSTPAHASSPDVAIDADALIPAQADTDSLAQLLEFIEAHESGGDTASTAPFYLSGIAEHDRVELTAQVRSILKQVVAALSKGQAISVLTRDQEITTQQAAEILGCRVRPWCA